MLEKTNTRGMEEFKRLKAEELMQKPDKLLKEAREGFSEGYRGELRKMSKLCFVLTSRSTPMDLVLTWME